MNTIKRIDPRRPFTITRSGLKRITLGEAFVAGAAVDGALPLPIHGQAQAKPRRAIVNPERVLLVAAHSDRGALDEPARQAVAAAAIVADARTEVVLVVFGELNDDAAELGADKLIEFRSLGRPAFAPDRELEALDRCVAHCKPAHILMPDNATGDGDLGRRYAALKRASIATHVVEIDAEHVGTYVDAGRKYATRAWPDVILLAPDAVSAKLPFTGAGQPIDVSDAKEAGSADGRIDSKPYGDLGTSQLDAADVALEEADFIVSAGNGVTDIAAFEGLARTLGAAIGASRVAVDNGHFTRDKQVGATGKTVNASVYIAFGISGAVQHLQGIKDCRHVIAVNLDASAPIAKRANLTIVGDARETIAALTEAVSSARAAGVSGGEPLAHGSKKLTEGVAA
ncbi:electron transfer flavoprotein subunit alpha [Trinickia symbiotica]|uniref:Electron transfer flavoprotein subunit alpha n=1 Tax=Trinickia symbiotica TaxID=863227 RepID=A0A2T3Y0G0_9BURK|nr:electron transfer flavoprotein subunit alpha/FixB family protein [Trinickia symbiotica]PTB22260.1 electron transfer flavoprotein subunit alpha [Trinickia symbiotica]